MTIGLSDEDRELRDSVRGWAARHSTPPAVIREAVEAKTETRPQYWDSLAELGMLGLHLPEEVGGAGFSLLETGIVAEELGRAMVPGPFLPTVIVSAVLNAAGRTDDLAGLADGSLSGAVSLQPGRLRITRDGDTRHPVRHVESSARWPDRATCSCSPPPTTVSSRSSLCTATGWSFAICPATTWVRRKRRGRGRRPAARHQ